VNMFIYTSIESTYINQYKLIQIPKKIEQALRARAGRIGTTIWCPNLLGLCENRICINTFSHKKMVKSIYRHDGLVSNFGGVCEDIKCCCA